MAEDPDDDHSIERRKNMELITQKRLLSTLARANLVGAFYSNDADFKIAFRFKNLGKYILFSSVPTFEKVKVSGGRP